MGQSSIDTPFGSGDKSINQPGVPIFANIRTKIRSVDIERNIVLQYFLLFAITSLAAVLRFYKLGEWSFWLDEIYTFNRAINFSTSSLAETLIGVTVNVLGPNEWNARLAPALIGVLTIPVLFFPIRQLFGGSVALLSSAFLAVSPWHVYWSQNARMYSLVLLLYTLAFLIFLIGIQKDQFWILLLSMVILYLAARERLFVFLFMPIALIYYALLKAFSFESNPLPGLRLKNLALLLIPIIIVGTTSLYQHLQTGPLNAGRDEIAVPAGYSAVDVFVAQFLGDNRANPVWLLASAVLLFGMPLVCMAFFESIYLLANRKSSEALFIVLGAMVPLTALPILALFVFTNERYIFIVLPAFTILGAMAALDLLAQKKGYEKLLAGGVLTLLLVYPLFQTGLYFKYDNGYRHDWKNAFNLVRSQRLDNDLVAVSYPEMGVYYLGGDIINGQDLNKDTVLQGTKRVWFVDGVWGSSSIPDWMREKSELKGVWDIQLPVKTLITRVYLYTPPVSAAEQVSR